MSDNNATHNKKGVKMSVHDATKNRQTAFALYLQGHDALSISKQMGVSYKTIITWIKKYDWKVVKSRVDSQIQTEISQRIADAEITSIEGMVQIAQDLYNEASGLSLKADQKVEGMAESRKWVELIKRCDGSLDDAPKVNLTITDIIRQGADADDEAEKELKNKKGGKK